jgi:type IV pilus assembly protein PilV
MIEVMIALVILAVGLLGIAAMQGIAVSRSVDARQLSAVTNLADEMLERIRFNAPT